VRASRRRSDFYAGNFAAQAPPFASEGAFRSPGSGGRLFLPPCARRELLCRASTTGNDFERACSLLALCQFFPPSSRGVRGNFLARGVFWRPPLGRSGTVASNAGSFGARNRSEPCPRAATQAGSLSGPESDSRRPQVSKRSSTSSEMRCESNARLEQRTGLQLRKCQRSQLVKRAIDRGFNRRGFVWQSKRVTPPGFSGCLLSRAISEVQPL
jgi:hypothetical protein